MHTNDGRKSSSNGDGNSIASSRVFPFSMASEDLLLSGGGAIAPACAVAASDAADDGDGDDVVKQEIYSAPVLQNFNTLNHSAVVPCVIDELRRLELLTADFENGVDFMTGTKNARHDLCECRSPHSYPKPASARQPFTSDTCRRVQTLRVFRQLS